MVLDGATLDPSHTYKLLIGSILPRAIGWISTLSAVAALEARTTASANGLQGSLINTDILKLSCGTSYGKSV